LATKKSQKKEKIDPKKYAEILRRVKLGEIYLDSCSVIHKRENLIKQKDLQVLIRDRASYEQSNGKIKVIHKYYLKTKKTEKEKDVALEISATFCLIYFSDTHFSEEFFEIFKNTNLVINSWPYLREFVQNITQRMNIPPLTLPLFRRVA